MLIHNADITGSLLVNGTRFNTGSFSGSFIAGTNVLSGDTVSLTGSLLGTASFASNAQQSVSSSFASTASFALNSVNNNTGSFTGSFIGDGSQLTGVTSSIQPISTVSDTFTSVTSYTVTHNFNTKEVIVSVYENDTVIFPSTINTPTVNTVTITFPEPVTGRVVVVKAGHIVSGSIDYSNVLNKPTLVSGSSQVTYSGLTGIPSGIVSGSAQVTYSGLTGIPSGIVSGSAQVAGFGIFATTGSNQFNGNQSITGSLTVTGQVVAQTLNVQQVTSSIVYSSGSNVFGNSLSNTQQFTGSVGVTGSLAVAGALNGTSAAFSSFGRFGGSNIATNFAVNTGANTSIYFNEIDSATTELSAVNNANNAVRILKLQSPGGGTQIGGTLAVTGSATFLSTLNGTSGNFSGNIQLGTIGAGNSTATPNSINLASSFSNTAGSNLKLKLFEDTGANIYGIGVSNNQMDFNVPSGATYRFYTGAATFNSSITTTSLTTGTSTGSSVNITTNNNNGTSGSPLQTNVNFYGFNGNLNGQIRVDDIAGTAQVGTMKFYTWNSGQVLALTLSQTGAATFSSSVAAKSNITVSNNGAEGAILSAVSAFADGYRATLRLWNQHTGGKAWEVYSTNDADGLYGGGKLAFVNSTNSVNALVLTSTGAATFSSSVNATTFRMADTAPIPIIESTTGANFNGIEFKNTGGSFYIGQDNSAGNFYGSNSAYAGCLYTSQNRPIVFSVNAVERARVTANGITFNGDTAAANALDDYEEGTWTPVVKIGTTTNSGSAVGKYTKIGNVVYIQATITSITKSGTGGLTVEGLPFTIGTSFGEGHGVLRWGDITSSGVIYPYFNSGNTNIIMQDFSNTGYVNTIQHTQIGSTYHLYGISGFYMV